ncbi:unnamed protein product, partial [Sphacelaria rigidula]
SSRDARFSYESAPPLPESSRYALVDVSARVRVGGISISSTIVHVHFFKPPVLVQGYILVTRTFLRRYFTQVHPLRELSVTGCMTTGISSPPCEVNGLMTMARMIMSTPCACRAQLT